jgi:DNA-binding XRE family transcriptional regulator
LNQFLTILINTQMSQVDMWTTVTHKKSIRKNPDSSGFSVNTTNLSPSHPMLDEPHTILKKIVAPQTQKEKRPQTSSSIGNHHRRVEDATDGGDLTGIKRSYPDSFRKRLVKFRNDYKQTQKQLSTSLNVRESVIKSIENGTATYDHKTMELLNNQLQLLEKHPKPAI